MENNDLLERVQQTHKWMRGLYMALFLVVLWILKILFLSIIVLQFLIVLLTDQVNEHLHSFSKTLSSYAYQIYLFLTYNTDVKPFPFSNWPNF